MAVGKKFFEFFKPALLILFFMFIAMALLLGLARLIPGFSDLRVGGWLIYVLGCILIFLFYLKMRRQKNLSQSEERHLNEKTDRAQDEGPLTASLEDVRKRLRLRRGKKRSSG